MTDKTDNTRDWQKIAEKADEEIKAESAEKKDTDHAMGVLEHPDYKALAEKLTAAEQLAHENWDKAVRAMSELENVKRRTKLEIERDSKRSLESFAKELLPILDSLDQAFQSCANDTSDNVKGLRAGVELTLKLFYGVLSKFHIEVINPLGEKFDPSLHEAVLMQETDIASSNTILTVVQNGYRLHDRVLRPARVIVAKNKT